MKSCLNFRIDILICILATSLVGFTGISFADDPPVPVSSPCLLLEINMIAPDVIEARYGKDTLLINIVETTTGDQIRIATTNSNVNIPFTSDKHYFVYLSSTGAVTQIIELETNGLDGKRHPLLFADYDPIPLEDQDSFNGVLPMSVVRFNEDQLGTIFIENVGINVLYEE